MKMAGPFMFLALACLCCISGVASQDIQEECKELWQKFRSGFFFCHRDNNPVRGPDGTMYANKCIMCRKLMFSQGNAPLAERGNAHRSPTGKAIDCSEFLPLLNANGELICTKENEPVRDSSGHSHLNKCVMCADKFKQEAQRGNLLARNNLQPPVNGTGGMTARQNGASQACENPPCSANSQAAQGTSSPNGGCGGTQEGTTQTAGNCGVQPGFQGERPGVGYGIIIPVDCRQILYGIKGRAILCQNSWQPVCGSDGKTYSSRCSLCLEMQRTGAHIALKSEGECAHAVPAKADCSQYPQTKGKVLCTPSSPVVCGTDGVTHSSECMLCDKILKTRSEIDIRNIGVCAQP